MTVSIEDPETEAARIIEQETDPPRLDGKHAEQAGAAGTAGSRQQHLVDFVAVEIDPGERRFALRRRPLVEHPTIARLRPAAKKLTQAFRGEERLFRHDQPPLPFAVFRVGADAERDTGRVPAGAGLIPVEP
ncbi:MAG: hypothetical protein WED34_10820 [Planctomycetales bacterium]